MEKLGTLLEYQKVDIALRKELDEIERSDDSKNLERARNEFNAAKSAVAESESTAEGILAYYESALASFEEISKEIEALDSGDLDDPEKRRALTESLEKIKAKLSELERRLNEKHESGEKAIMKYLEGQERGKKMREVYGTVKARLDKIKEAHEPKIAEYRSKLDALRGGIPANLLEMYNALTAERKYPAFVEAIEADKKNYRCFCGLTLSQKAKSELSDNGFCRCETCRRVIYKPQEK